MKKLLLGIFMLLCLVSCGSGPSDTVSKFINNIKAGKPKEAAKYAIDDGFEGNLEVTYTNKTQELLFKTLLKNLEYKIIGTEKQDSDTTIVTVEVTNLDVQKVFLQVFQKMSQEVFTNKDSKPLSAEERFKQELEAKDKPKIKNTTKFVVKKTPQGEKVVVTAENVDVLLGKLNTTLLNLGNLGKTDEETSVELPETGPSTGISQKPEELRNQNK
ncbi:hypothetical protein HMPREF3180_00405 [Leptotrichia wadei]|jgi:hypothetical protein|uniref:DUF4878 domain-containing protein n=1 Tax=Leptotrichia wadei TaxID=157687 RepID=A0A134ANK5_9FUSO|nr:DUF4878 domain-containing protein [Leptotrichia wadei]KXB69285.1 hypothetical protein HMPREF3180_00405 [Leptotrichia wadei]BBM42026.1 hypothetical protein JCM16777_0262 [Leptotrichia wadei]BBM46790.1 hypothetical protein JMUB3933_0277 [Leptotrichia wadei]BBM49007.1 hypothetical protein JMUB3934_0289 [Leptotrichia wadei]